MHDYDELKTRQLTSRLSLAFVGLLVLLIHSQHGRGAETRFVPPRVTFIDNDQGATLGAQRFRDLIPDPETLIQNACAEVCFVLYDRFALPRNRSEAQTANQA